MSGGFGFFPLKTLSRAKIFDDSPKKPDVSNLFETIKTQIRT